MGMTVVIPDMDPTKPAEADPRKLVEAIEAMPVPVPGSPAIWKNLASWGARTGLKLPTMKRIMMAGVPVPVTLHEQLQSIFDGKAELHTPYGATESFLWRALPATSSCPTPPPSPAGRACAWASWRRA